MSSISAVQAPGLAFITAAKPDGATQGDSSTTAAPLSAPPKSIYPNPVYGIDAISGKAIIDYRNTQNGDVTQQMPPESVVRLYQTSASVGAGGSTPGTQTRSSAA